MAFAISSSGKSPLIWRKMCDFKKTFRKQNETFMANKSNNMCADVEVGHVLVVPV